MNKNSELKPSASQADIASVVAKLGKWKQKLDADEQAVIDLIIERSTDVTPEMVESIQVRNALAEELPALMNGIMKRVDTTFKPTKSWMKIGPIWVKSGASGFEVSPRVLVERVR